MVAAAAAAAAAHSEAEEDGGEAERILAEALWMLGESMNDPKLPTPKKPDGH